MLLLSGCGSLGANVGAPVAQVRFVEVAPGAPEMDFYINGTGAAYGVGYQSFTSYLPVSSGSVSLVAQRTGASQSLTAAQGSLVAGRQYTAVVSRTTGSAVHQHIYTDQDTPAAPGQVSLRVLNEIGGAEAATFYVTLSDGSATPLAVWNAAAGTGTAYATLPVAPGYTVTATVPASGWNLPVASLTVKAPSEAVRTLVFSGTAGAKAHSSVTGFILVDADAP